MENLDEIFMADLRESMGMPGRFAPPPEPIPVPEEERDPLLVSDVGIPQEERSLGQTAAGFGQTLLDMLRGAGIATVGAGGDIEALVTGIKRAIQDEGDDAWKAFQEGMAQETFLPSSEDVKTVVPEIPQFSDLTPEQRELAGGLGEFAGIPGAVKGVTTTAKFMSKTLKPKKIAGVSLTPSGLAENATKLWGDMSSKNILKKYVENFAGRRNIDKSGLCHDQACRFVMEKGSEPGDKLLMLKTGQKDFVAHTVVLDKKGNMKYDNFNGEWDGKTKTYTAPEVDEKGNPIPPAFREFTSYEVVDIDVLKEAADLYKGTK